MFLKLYVAVSQEQQVLFIGQVVSPDGLRIEASLPLSIDVMYYEIFSAGASKRGLIRVVVGSAGGPTSEAIR